VQVTVNPVNDAPVANDDSASTEEDTPVTIDVTANDFDVEDGDVVVSAFSQALNGSVALNGDGTLTYTPDADFHGMDFFYYETVDEAGAISNVAEVMVTVNPVNDAPVAGSDSASTDEDTPVTIAVLANDTDVEGDALVVDSYTDADHGAVVLNPDGSFTYAPDADYFGADDFTYTVSDGRGGIDSATVSLVVNPVNDAPLAHDDALTAVADTPVTYAAAQLLANDVDVEGDVLTISSVTSVSGGTAVLNVDGTVSFTPEAGFAGAAVFTYAASDGSLLSNTATATVTVQPSAGEGAIDIEKYVKVAGKGGKDRPHKGNEGVGNGEDPPPPGHDYNQNDGPGTGPGNPGSKGGSQAGSGGHGHGDHDTGEHCGDDHSPGDGGYGVDADAPPGLIAGAGEEIVFTYIVTNPGTVAIADVTVTDDNQTPGVPGDDFRPDPVLKKGYNVGDTDRDGLLDPGEAWIYSWSALVIEGAHVNVATVTGTLVEGGDLVTDFDAAHWLGVDRHDASIGNFVWDDRDRDGMQDSGEKGIKGVKVQLLDASGAVVASMATDARGYYHFTALAAGTYTVAVAESNFVRGGALSGWAPTLQDRGSSDARDSDGDRDTHRSAPVVLMAGERNSDIDFGFKRSGHDDHCGKKHGHDDWHRDPWGRHSGHDDHGGSGERSDDKRDNNGRDRHRDRDAGKGRDGIDWSDRFRYSSLNPYATEGGRACEWTCGFVFHGKGKRE
jgi:hypothetical protein